MAINWFPGHMHKARKEIKKVMPQMDLIIEVVDARIPFSSENPLVPALRGDTPLIKVLNKRDLADPEITEQWLSWLEKERGVRAITLTHNQRNEALSILKLAEEMTPGHDRQKSALRVMILGIPNVGKSTLINTLAGRPAAKTGNEQAKLSERIAKFEACTNAELLPRTACRGSSAPSLGWPREQGACRYACTDPWRSLASGV